MRNLLSFALLITTIMAFCPDLLRAQPPIAIPQSPEEWHISQGFPAIPQKGQTTFSGGIHQKDPCPPCPDRGRALDTHRDLPKARASRAHVAPRPVNGDVIVNVDCGQDNNSGMWSHGPVLQDPMPTYSPNDGTFVSSNAQFWWLLFVTIAVAVIIGHLITRNNRMPQASAPNYPYSHPVNIIWPPTNPPGSQPQSYTHCGITHHHYYGDQPAKMNSEGQQSGAAQDSGPGVADRTG